MVEHISLRIPGFADGAVRVEVRSPFDGSLLATVAKAERRVTESALATAYGLSRDRSSWLPVWKRIEILEKTALIMASRHEALAVGAASEGGKPLIDSRVEVTRAIDGVRLAAETLRTQAGHEIPMGLGPSSANRLALTTHEPIGVVVAVSAFNHPLNLIVHQVAPAIAAGCPVVIKPAEPTPLSCFRFVDILREAGLPAEWCLPLLPESRDVTTALISDPRVAFLSFIGSPGVGWMLRSKLAPGTRCALEHGGVAPVIVAADADLDAAVPLLAKGGFYHAGQVCVSVQRVFAHESIADELAARLAAAGNAMVVGDPTDSRTEVGPLIRPEEVERVDDWVQEAVRTGGKLLSGGSRLGKTCYKPTVLLNPPADARVSTTEVFGPVICVFAYSDMDEALQQANSLPYAFQAAVFTRSIDTALRVYKRMDASAVMVNDHTAFRVDWMPFAGLRQSGHGVGGIPHTLKDMQIEKMLVIRSKEL
jgi:acyl-CoA reductase-like NAD-dependent aldehyde dehydrogenase